MYVVPFITRLPDGSRASGMQVTDSPALAAALEEGEVSCEAAWAALSRKGPALLCLHAEGRHAMPVGRAWNFPSERALLAIGPGFDTVGVIASIRCDGRWS